MAIFTLKRFSLFIIWLVVLSSCDKQTETFNTETVADYIVLQPGKYITYRLDSTVFTNFGRKTEIHRYQEKHVVDAMFTDNQGRASYRVYKFIRDSAGVESWQSNGSYFITPLANSIEVVDDNLRFIKIHEPFRDGFSWKGNKYLPAEPYAGRYNFSNDDNMEDWEYFFDGDAGTYKMGTQTIPDVYTIVGANESFNLPITDPSSYAAKTLLVEKYAKNIGLVYKEYALWEHQPNPTGNPPNIIYDPYKTGFEIRLWMIDHN